MKKIFYIIPFIMVVVTLYSCYFPINYVVLGNILGNSILANLWLFYIVYNTKGFCKYSKAMPFLLTAINLIDIIGYYVNFDFYALNLKAFICFSILILIFIKIKENESNNKFSKK